MQNTNSDTLNVAQIGRATRFAVACVVLGFSYLAIRSSLSITRFASIFQDMLGESQHLPLLTTFVLRARPAFIALSFCIPVAAIGLLFTRSIPRSLYCLGGLVLVSLVECVVLFHALSSPLVTIIELMQGPSQQ